MTDLGACAGSSGAGRGLPGGVVTFLFSDIEGSTRLVKALRGRYPQVLAEYRRLVRAAVTAHGGHEVDTQGDGFFVAFGGAGQAVACALAVQRALAAHRWPAGAPVRVRIGVHTGEAVLTGQGYTGVAVHRAARICAVAGGGQVLVSQAAQAVIADQEEDDPGFALVDAGEYQLKDLDWPVRLYELAAPGLDTARPARAEAAAAAGAGGVHGFPAALTSFVGRERAAGELAGLLEGSRLVTVTGPGGVGKTRLAGEVAGRVAARFADGAWLAELAAVRDPAQVAPAVAVALGVREQPGMPAAQAVARVLARRQLLLVLDNCEHVIGAAAQLCAGLLQACDDMRILATGREPLRIAGEAAYRLAPLPVPGRGDAGDDAAGPAVVLFTDRARAADAGFALTGQNRGDVVRLVVRLDGMPLAIELAAARVEALGVSQLLGLLDGRLGLLAGGDRLAAGRHRSLAAVAEWSYQLLDEAERRVFRLVSVFPAPFTLEAAEAVAGQGASAAVLRLVDCSLLVPPRPGPDGRSRYGMLETLRGYGAGLQAEAGEQDDAEAALARYAVGVAEQAVAGVTTSTGESSAARWLDAEDATMRHVLAWAVEHDLDMAARLVTALVWWWLLRGRVAGQGPLLRELAGRAEPGSDGWCAAQLWLGWIAFDAADLPGALQRCAAILDVTGDREPSRILADCLGLQSFTLSNAGRVPEAAGCARRALSLARELGYPSGQVLATNGLVIAASWAGDLDDAARLARLAGQIADIPRGSARVSGYLLAGVLAEAGDLAAAEQACADALAQARDAGDLNNLGELLTIMADLDLRARRTGDAAAHLREAAQLSLPAGTWFNILNVLYLCGYLCDGTGSPADAITIWAAHDTLRQQRGFAELDDAETRRRDDTLRQARAALGPDRARAAEQRGAAMSLATAAEYVLLVTAPAQPAGPSELGQLSARERELVTLVAQGRTNAQIAAQLRISVRTVGSHLDRIRDKTGCRRRADLTRLALTEGLV
jgi:predicted ATPase/class 3 adenylate cyclase/DNA-binding CsgD family transcriptional regulator/tetratricopeptide (TPR) repeat protein